MSSATALPAEYLLHFRQEIEIEAPIAIAFESVLEQVGSGATSPDGKSMAMKLEAWPGGRWFRDLGNNAGHFWGHVQVIKPPSLLELTGPMFMSFPVISHIQYRLTEKGPGTLLALTHRAIGEIPPELRNNVSIGWGHILSSIKKRATR